MLSRVLLCCLALLGSMNCHAANEFKLPDIPKCGAASGARPCATALTKAEVRYLQRQVARRGQYFEVRGDVLLAGFDASNATLTYGDKPFLCCDVQAPLQRLRNGVFGIKIRSPNLSKAVLTLGVSNVELQNEAFRYRGSEHFVLADDDVALPTQAELELERISLPFAADSSETRTVSIFRGAACKETIANCTVVYMADGQSLERLLLAAWHNGRRLTDLVLVGVHNADTDGSNRRMAELLRVSEEPDFDLFKQFVFGTVRNRVESGQAPRKRYAAGMSNGGAWALSMLAEQPDLFDGAIVMSPAMWDEPAGMDVAGKALIIGAGLLEDGALRHAQKIAGLCTDKGASVAAIYPPSGHSMNSWVNIWIGALKALEH